jgi:acyl carrier protein|tara:strand:+ start:164 stop:418 length:255 start_codon:yes stop_codon:yes gene_type:complete
MPDYIATVVDITSRTLDIDPSKITPSSRFTDDLGADSLDCVDLMVSFEEAFGFEIAEEDLSGLMTIGGHCAPHQIEMLSDNGSP